MYRRAILATKSVENIYFKYIFIFLESSNLRAITLPRIKYAIGLLEILVKRGFIAVFFTRPKSNNRFFILLEQFTESMYTILLIGNLSSDIFISSFIPF